MPLANNINWTQKNMSSLDQLAEIKPKENAGASSANRFDYQINWGLRKLLDMEQKDEDYIMVLDYHDDIVICNSDSQKDYIDFYQIKTKSDGSWTLPILCKRKKDNSHSILGKLILHTKIFEKTRYLYFVTDSRIVFEDSKDYEQFSSLKESSRGGIKSRLNKEFGDLNNVVYDKLVFVQNQMHTNDYKNSMLGTLMRFLKDKFDLTTDTQVVYDNLITELKRKNDYENSINDKKDLLDHKAVSHTEFRSYLEGLTILKSFQQIRDHAITDINSSKYPNDDLTFATMTSIKINFQKLESDLLDYSHDELRRLIGFIILALNENEVEENIDLDFWKYVCRIYDIVTKDYNNYQSFSKLYIKTLIAYEYERQLN